MIQALQQAIQQRDNTIQCMNIALAQTCAPVNEMTHCTEKVVSVEQSDEASIDDENFSGSEVTVRQMKSSQKEKGELCLTDIRLLQN